MRAGDIIGVIALVIATAALLIGGFALLLIYEDPFGPFGHNDNAPSNISVNVNAGGGCNGGCCGGCCGGSCPPPVAAPAPCNYMTCPSGVPSHH